MKVGRVWTGGAGGGELAAWDPAIVPLLVMLPAAWTLPFTCPVSATLPPE